MKLILLILNAFRLSELDVDSVPIVGPNENESTLKEQLSRMEPLRSVDPCKDIQVLYFFWGNILPRIFLLALEEYESY